MPHTPSRVFARQATLGRSRSFRRRRTSPSIAPSSPRRSSQTRQRLRFAIWRSTRSWESISSSPPCVRFASEDEEEVLMQVRLRRRSSRSTSRRIPSSSPTARKRNTTSSSSRPEPLRPESPSTVTSSTTSLSSAPSTTQLRLMRLSERTPRSKRTSWSLDLRSSAWREL